MSHCVIALIERSPAQSSFLFGSEVIYDIPNRPPVAAQLSTCALIEGYVTSEPHQLIIWPLVEGAEEAKELLEESLERVVLKKEQLSWRDHLIEPSPDRDQRILDALQSELQGYDEVSLDASLLSSPLLVQIGNLLNEMTQSGQIKRLSVWQGSVKRGLMSEVRRGVLSLLWTTSEGSMHSDSESQEGQEAQDTQEPVQQTAQSQDDPPAKPKLSPEERAYKVLYQQYESLVFSMYKPDKKQKAQQLYTELTQRFPERSEEVKALRQRIKDANQLLNTIYQQAARHGRQLSKAQLKRIEELDFYQLLERGQSQSKKGLAAFERKRESNKRRKEGKALSSVKPSKVVAEPALLKSELPAIQRLAFPIDRSELHRNDIRGLKPWKSWTMLIDETGNNFETGQGHVKSAFTSILVPEGRLKLPSLGLGWHATETNKLSEVDRVMQTILDHDIGVLGVSLDSIPATRSDRWLDGIISIIELALRLLPLDEPTHLLVKIENRAQYSPKYDLSDLEHLIMNRLGRAWPERARRIGLSLKIITKTQDARIGYADALAYSWGSPRAESKARIRQSELIGPCLINDSAEELVAIWDQFDGVFKLQPQRWIELATRGDAQVESASLTSTLLRRYAEHISERPQQWGRLVEVCLDEEFKKIHSIRRLGQLIQWLELSRPAEESLPQPMRLVWETVKLSERNHKGELSNEGRTERIALAQELFEEDARLVCEADLYEAVSLTNQFQYQAAADLLSPWLEHPRALVGLRLWGRLHSSLGQHAAFLGQSSRAYEHFQEALESFSKLSHEQQRDLDQTSTYAVIAQMDDAQVSDEALIRSMSAYLNHEPKDRIPALATSEIADQYQHHTLLRWLVMRGHELSEKLYLSQRENWQSEEGHPWPLITAYRAILLARAAGGPTEESRELLSQAIDLTRFEGPTVAYIGAVLKAYASQWGRAWPTASEELQGLKELFPVLTEQLETLKGSLSEEHDAPLLTPAELSAWFDRFLRFNFR